MSSERSSSGQARGFTLLEITIALAVAGIALIALLTLSNRSVGVNERLQMITQATLLAQGKMGETEAAADRKTLRFEKAEGVFEAPYDRFRWEIAFASTPLPQVLMVTVKVLWGEEQRNELVELNSFLF